jgi:hypothetical protein
MEDFRTCDGVLRWLENSVRAREPIGPETWLNASQYLNILQGEEQNKLFDMQHAVSKMKVGYIESGDSVAKADAKVEASESYLEMLKQKAKIERIQESIRISKIQARLSDEEYKAQ